MSGKAYLHGGSVLPRKPRPLFRRNHPEGCGTTAEGCQGYQAGPGSGLDYQAFAARLQHANITVGGKHLFEAMGR
jgi:hypothetical protein